MKIKIQDGYTLIKAESGYFLTNNHGIFGIEIILGLNDFPENYKEKPLSEWPSTGTDDLWYNDTGTDDYQNYEFNKHIETAKEKKINEIIKYDSSSSVNSFYYDGIRMWLDRETRASLKNTIESFILIGRNELNIWYESIKITLDIQSAKVLLASLEVYATDCYNVTAQHKANVMALKTIKEIEEYNYTEGYPNKLEF